MFSTLILAHGGGWDDLLVAFLPVLLVVGVMHYAGRRRTRRERSQNEESHRQDEA